MIRASVSLFIAKISSAFNVLITQKFNINYFYTMVFKYTVFDKCIYTLPQMFTSKETDGESHYFYLSRFNIPISNVNCANKFANAISSRA